MNDFDTNDNTDEELKKNENVSLLIGVGCVLSIIGVNYLLGIILPNNSNKSLITYLADLVIAVIFLCGYLLYFWKSDLEELFKRIRVAAPLALAVLVFARILFANISINVIGIINGGLYMFFLLLLKTPDRKQHFTVIMTLALTAIIILKFLQVLSPAEGEEASFLKMVLPFACTMPMVCFF